MKKSMVKWNTYEKKSNFLRFTLQKKKKNSVNFGSFRFVKRKEKYVQNQ